MKTIFVVVALLVLLALIFVAQYNRLVRLNVSVDEAFAQIEVQLKRRADLIPNLVEVVKGY
ncbi:MAG: LemA family protein, partial [Actinobacteria bacterium]|nr:LemA family protein [Actinomycetota bacterium]